MVDDETFQMRIAISFAGAVMPIIVAIRRETFEPGVDILDEPVFGIALT